MLSRVFVKSVHDDADVLTALGVIKAMAVSAPSARKRATFTDQSFSWCAECVEEGDVSLQSNF